MKKLVCLILTAMLATTGLCSLAAAPNGAPPPVPTAEAETYTGIVRDYADKRLWFDSTVYGGFYSAYQIMKGNGDDTFDVDAFINSAMGELAMSRIKYELCLLGDKNSNSDYMINYWKGRGVIQTAYETTDATKTWITFVPDYMREKGNTAKYPVVFCYHGNGGTLFEAIDHGFVDICYDNSFMVVCPENGNMDAKLTVDNLPRYLDQMEKEGYPIDRTRVYVTGMSKGGKATLYTGIKCGDIVAAIAAHGCPGFGFSYANVNEVLDGLNLTKKEVAACKGMPLYLQVGESDMNQLPLTADNISVMNDWLKMNGCKTPAKAADTNMLGVTGDKVYTRYIDGTEYTFAEYFDGAGVNKLSIVGIKGLPHWVSYSYSQLAWDFLSQYSRVDGELVVEK